MWFSRDRIKEYIDAIMIEAKLISEHEKTREEYSEKPSPLLPASGNLYGLKIKCRYEQVPEVIGTVFSFSKKVVVEEVYARNHGGQAKIYVFVYASGLESVWKIVDRLLEIEGISKVDVIKSRSRESIILNPWFFPPVINNTILSLIPIDVLCGIDKKNALLLAEKLAEIIINGIDKNIHYTFIPRIIETFGLGRIEDEKYSDDKALFEVSCQNKKHSSGYCVFLKQLVAMLTKMKVKAVEEDNCCRLLLETS